MDTQAKEYSSLLEYNLMGLQNNKILDLTFPILLFVSRLSKINGLDSGYIGNVKETLAGEILTISGKLSASHKYDDRDLIKLRYCLCVFIDEILLSNESFINSHWANHTLTIRLFNETLGGDKFYDIAGQWLLTPEKHKDMLEFIYACLVLGYTGKYAFESIDKINYLCNDIASAIAPALHSSEQTAFNLPHRITSTHNHLAHFKQKYLKPFLLFAIVGIIAVAFTFSFLKLESNNTIVQNKLAQDIQSFVQTPQSPKGKQ